MRSIWARARGRSGIVFALMATAFLAGCGASTPMGRAGVEVRPPSGWTTRPVAGIVVPGTVIAAWAGPEGATLSVATSLPIPNPSASALATEFANRMANTPGVRVDSTRIEAVDRKESARVDLVERDADRRVIVAISLRNHTVLLTWTFPNNARATIDPAIAATLGASKIVEQGPNIMSY